MKGTIRITYDAKNDVYVAYPRWTIETEDDCKEWYSQYENFFKTVRGPVDLIFLLDDFHIGKGIGATWGKYRVTFMQKHTRFTVRVHSDAKVATFVATSSAQHNVMFDDAKDVETAVALIHAYRAKMS